MTSSRASGAAGGRRPPVPVVVLAGSAVALIAVPVAALLVRAPWGSMAEVLARPMVRDALRLSLVTSFAATALSALLGIPLAWVLARVAWRGRTVVRAVVLLPMVLPPVVGGAALLAAFGRRGVVGGPLHDAGLLLPYSTAGVVLAQTFVAMPFLVIAMEAGFRSLDARYEDAATTLGARPTRVFRTVTLPLVAPSLVAGLVLCWARALGEFGATIAFAGNLQGRTQTLPLAIYLGLQGDRDAALAMAVLLVAVSLVVLVALRERWFRPGGVAA